MGQVSWRVDDELLERVRHSARAAGVSVNAYISRVMAVATSEDAEAGEGQRLRQRLVAAGLLDVRTAPTTRPGVGALEAAGAEAATGTALSDIIVAERE